MHNQIHPVSAHPTNLPIAGDVSTIIQPYRRYIEGWQLRATYLSGQLTLHPSGSDAHDLAQLRRAELQHEIAVNRDALIAETSGLPPDDLIDAMVDELSELVSTVSGLAS
jgi:hypothetical protein